MTNIKSFFDIISHTFSYVVTDVDSNMAVIIDPVLGFDINRATLDYQVIRLNVNL